jgi:hypothetical protein
VSKVGFGNTGSSSLYSHIMDMEMEGRLNEMIEHLLASQEKTNAKIEARLERIETATHSTRSDLERAI